MCEPTADLHGRVPLPVLAGEELVVALERVALVTEVLDDCFVGEPVAGRRVAAVTPVLRLRGRQTHVVAEAAWRWVGPGAQAGADDADWPVRRVAGLTAVREQGARGEGAAVSFGLVQQVSMLHSGRPSTS